MPQVRDLGEAEIIAQLVSVFPEGKFTLLGSGDDCAVIHSPQSRFVVSTDVLVEGQHFRSEWSTGFEVGARAMAQNLADIAAMGAIPTAAVVSMVLPEDTEMSWLLEVANGFAAEVRPTGAGIVGGDLSLGKQLVISVTVHGHVAGDPITRSGAQPGDTVAIVGTLGHSAAGLAALESGVVSPQLHGDEIPIAFAKAVSVYRTPKPPLEAGPLAAGKGATAMMDISDGLVRDSGRLAKASGVTIELSLDALRSDCAVLRDAGEELGVDPLQWVLYGGEDHSLLVTFPAGTLVTAPFRTVGYVGRDFRGKREGLVRLDGKVISGGWDHFGG